MTSPIDAPLPVLQTSRKEFRIATKPRVNKEIRSEKVRLIGAKGEQLGILLAADALRQADADDLDLVEVASSATPPVCRIMDYGKYKYEQTKKQHAAKHHQRGTHLKEVKFRPFTSQHDVDYKLRHVREFLELGHKVKLTVMFRGREMAHQDAGRDLLNRLREILNDISTPDQLPRSEGRNMHMIVSPKAKAGAAKKKPASMNVSAAAKPGNVETAPATATGSSVIPATSQTRPTAKGS